MIRILLPMVALLSLVSAAEASPRRMVCVGDLTDMRIIGVSIGSNVDDRGSYCSLNEISLRDRANYRCLRGAADLG
jgi:hypothetical protein